MTRADHYPKEVSGPAAVYFAGPAGLLQSDPEDIVRDPEDPVAAPSPERRGFAACAINRGPVPPSIGEVRVLLNRRTHTRGTRNQENEPRGYRSDDSDCE